MCKKYQVFVAGTLQTNVLTTNNNTLFYSTNIFKYFIESHTLNFQTNEHCMNIIMKIVLNIF